MWNLHLQIYELISSTPQPSKIGIISPILQIGQLKSRGVSVKLSQDLNLDSLDTDLLFFMTMLSYFQAFACRTLSLGFSSSFLTNSFFTTVSVSVSVRFQEGREQCTSNRRFWKGFNTRIVLKLLGKQKRSWCCSPSSGWRLEGREWFWKLEGEGLPCLERITTNLSVSVICCCWKKKKTLQNVVTLKQQKFSIYYLLGWIVLECWDAWQVHKC